MKLQCMKCNNVFTDEANDIYATTCGHIFHFNCIMQWLDRFLSCPHCSQRQMKEEVFRLYLNTSITSQQDPREVKNEFICLNRELELKTLEIKSIKEETKSLISENKELRKVLRKFKGEEDSINRTMSFNRLAIHHDKLICKGKDLAMLQAEVTRLTDRLRSLEGLREIVNSPVDEVDDILLKSTLSKADLLKCADSFQRKLNACNVRNEELDDGVMLHQMENDRLGTELKTLKREDSYLLRELCDSEDCGELADLRQKIFFLIQHCNLEDILYIFPDLEHSNKDDQTKKMFQETCTPQEMSTSPDVVEQDNVQPSPKSVLRKRCKEVIKFAMKNPKEYLNSGRVELYDSDEDSETVTKKKPNNKHSRTGSSKFTNNFNQKKYKNRLKNKHLSADCGLFRKPKAQKVDMKAIDRSVIELMANDS